MRYSKLNNIKKNRRGNRVYKTPIYPKINTSSTDIYLQSKSTDRLDLLAYKYYGDRTLWWIIAHANKIKGTLYLPEETQIWIPMNITKILSDYQELNNGR